MTARRSDGPSYFAGIFPVLFFGAIFWFFSH